MNKGIKVFIESRIIDCQISSKNPLIHNPADLLYNQLTSLINTLISCFLYQMFIHRTINKKAFKFINIESMIYEFLLKKKKKMVLLVSFKNTCTLTFIELSGKFPSPWLSQSMTLNGSYSSPPGNNFMFSNGSPIRIFLGVPAEDMSEPFLLRARSPVL